MISNQNYPSAIKPIYTTKEPNQNIFLYKGKLRITQQTKLSSQKDGLKEIVEYGQGKLELTWFPSPIITFQFTSSNQNNNSPYLNDFDYTQSNAFLELCELNLKAKVFISKLNPGNKYNEILGYLAKPIETVTEEKLYSVTFHVANFHDFDSNGSQDILFSQDSEENYRIKSNRIIFQTEQWRLTLDNLESTKNIVKQLNKTQNGFAITHVGKLEKVNGQSFSVENAKEILEAFTGFLSFARGFRIPLFLLLGYDSEDNKIWQCWDASGGNFWKVVDSWFPKCRSSDIQEIFSGFLTWWQNWEESEKLGFYWYLEANYNPLIEQKIITGQLALEELAWTLLVKKEQILSKRKFKDNKTCDNLRKLLLHLKIPGLFCQVPTTLIDKYDTNNSPPIESLIKLSVAKEWTDGVQVLIQLRNDIIHPEKEIENTAGISLHGFLNDDFRQANLDGAQLVLWYLELVFLAIFNYKKHYNNRLYELKYGEKTEFVPWSENL